MGESGQVVLSNEEIAAARATKTAARWRHPSGWELHHCGHPTANYPWALYDPQGLPVSRGYSFDPPEPGDRRAWQRLEEAFAFVDTILTGSRPWPPAPDTRMGSVERAIERRKAGT